MYNKCISKWLIVLIIIMIFCVSHQKQLSILDDDNNANKNSMSNDLKGDDANAAEIITQSNISTTQQNLSMIRSSGGSNTILDNNHHTNNVTTFSESAVVTADASQETIETLENSQTLRLTQRNRDATDGNVIDVVVTSSPSNLLESSTEKLSLSNKSFVSDALTNSSTNVTSNNDSFSHANTTSVRPLNNSLISNSTVQNMHHSKSTKQRGSSNNLMKTSSSSGGGSGGIRVSGQKIEMPQLNNFFDHREYLKKHEHGFRYGPHFETGNVTNITVQVGNTFYLHCRISLLQDKTVSWVRRKSGENGLELLTVGKQTYSGDPRYSVDFQYPNNWRLKIVAAQKIDEATYECQISTSPPRFIHYNVRVNAPTIFIVDEQGIPLLDKYYEVDSTIRLTCIVRHISMMSSVVFWIHNNHSILNYDVTRGGISVKTDLMEIGANSTLLVARVNTTDAGNYTCSIGESQMYTVLVHVLNEESLAELHHSGYHTETWKQNYYLRNILLIALLLSTINQFILRGAQLR